MATALVVPENTAANLYCGTLSISGTVRNDAGAVCVRTVLLINRLTGQIEQRTESASDGTYSFQYLPNVEYLVVCLDDDAGTTYNDLILRAAPG